MGLTSRTRCLSSNKGSSPDELNPLVDWERKARAFPGLELGDDSQAGALMPTKLTADPGAMDEIAS